MDLFSVTAIKILAAETGTEKFTAIIEATKSLSEYTHSFGNALYETPRNDFDLITHSILQIARTWIKIIACNKHKTDAYKAISNLFFIIIFELVDNLF